MLKANLVIIGSGGGLAAAVQAAELGVTDIVVLEKDKLLGGEIKFAAGLFACESVAQKRENYIVDKDKCFKLYMQWTHLSRINPRLVRAYINKSGDTISWLEEKGARFHTITIHPNQWPRVWHSTKTNMKGVTDVLVQSCKDLGVNLLTNTRASKILRNDAGNIIGVLAEQGDQQLQIETSYVIIATGGFHCNRELLKKHCPDYFDGMQLFDFVECMGDGLKMAEEMGAVISNDVPIFHEGPNPVGPKSVWGIGVAVMKEPYMVWVNKNGKRFCDEMAGYMRWEAGNAILSQPDKLMYSLFDDATREQIETKGLLTGMFANQRDSMSGFSDKIADLAEKGVCKISSSWDEIAEWIGAEPAVLRSEVDEYNAYCANGYDALFAKDRRHLLPLVKAPFCAIKGSVGCGETMGGVKVNEKMEVLDANGNSIKGLYVIGMIADGWQAQTYCSLLTGSGVGFAINSGRIAGENVAKAILGQ